MLSFVVWNMNSEDEIPSRSGALQLLMEKLEPDMNYCIHLYEGSENSPHVAGLIANAADMNYFTVQDVHKLSTVTDIIKKENNPT